MSDSTLPAASYVLLPLDKLDIQKRLNECGRSYCLDVTGPSAEAAIGALPAPESVAPGYPEPTRYVHISTDHWRVYKQSLQMVRMVENTIERWRLANLDAEFTTRITSTEWSSQRYADAVQDKGSALLDGNLIFEGGPWKVERVIRNGEMAAITLVNLAAKPAPKPEPKAAPARAKKSASKKGS